MLFPMRRPCRWFQQAWSQANGGKGNRAKVKTYEIGYVHIDSCQLRHAATRRGKGPLMYMVGP
jgi:hypothetical protein